jgi:hypothetical protein
MRGGGEYFQKHHTLTFGCGKEGNMIPVEVRKKGNIQPKWKEEKIKR